MKEALSLTAEAKDALSLTWEAMERAREREDPSMPEMHKYRVRVTPRDVPQKV